VSAALDFRPVRTVADADRNFARIDEWAATEVVGQPRRVTAATSLYPTDQLLLCDTAGGGYSVTLPLARTMSPKVYRVKLVNGANTLTLTASGSELIYASTGAGAGTFAWATTGASYGIVPCRVASPDTWGYVVVVDYSPSAGGGAPTGATYITQTPDATLSAEQALSLLGTGLLKNTTGTGVLSIGVAGTDYAAAAHATQHKDGGGDVLLLHELGDPSAAVEFAQQQGLQFCVENRTSDPASPATGQLWLRTDL
jgi:hypothetical protein